MKPSLVRWFGIAIVVGLTFGWRIVEPGFDRNHFRMMTEGRQVLLAGELPYRDFVDPGIFLQIFTSTALQFLFGYNLLGQALFGTAIQATAMALTFLLARRVSGASPIALVVTLLVIAMDPRLKQHHVILLPVLGLLFCWRYVDRPTLHRLGAISFVTALAFLLRHDQGVYLGAAAGSTLIAMHWRCGVRLLLRRVGLYVVVTTVVLAPFFLFLQANGGIIGYFRSASEYVRSEAESQGVLRWPEFSIDRSAPLVAIEAAPPPPPAGVNIRWTQGVTAELRAELEQQYELTKPTRHDDPKGRTWAYILINTSEANVTALAKDPRVEDTAGIDRRRYAPTGLLDEPFHVTWWRDVPLLGLRVLPGVLRPANAVPWLYYVVVGVPVLALLMLLRQSRGRIRGESWPSEASKIFGAAVMCLFMYGSLREPLSDRLADLAATPAILATWLLGQILTCPRSPPTATRGKVLPSIAALAPRLMTAGVAVSLVGLTLLSVVSLPNVQRRVERATMLIQHGSVTERSLKLLHDLRTSPPIEAPQGISDASRTLPQYIRECTKPTDRLLVTWFAPEFYFYADRRFAGRQLFWFKGYYSSPEEQARSIESLRLHPVPIIIHRLNRGQDIDHFEHVRDYIVEHYDPMPRSTFVSDSYQILVDRRRAPTGKYEPLSLPCFS